MLEGSSSQIVGCFKGLGFRVPVPLERGFEDQGHVRATCSLHCSSLFWFD